MRIPSYFVHEKAICESNDIGEKTRIWAFVHILSQAKIGKNCNICDHVFIENNVVIGDNVTIKSGVQLWDGIRIEDDVFIGPNATFTNDRFPRSKVYPDQFMVTTIEKGASIGANATILPGITIGKKAMIGAGSVVTKNVPSFAIMAGNPAKIIGFDKKNHNPIPLISPAQEKKIPLWVSRCELWQLPSVSDTRGSIMINEFSKNLPFEPKRCFFIYGVNENKIRGEHAHQSCKQFLIAVHGKVSVLIDDGLQQEEIILDAATTGLFIPNYIWATQYHFSSDAVLCVFASDVYSEEDYIRNYNDFLRSIQKNKCIDRID